MESISARWRRTFCTQGQTRRKEVRAARLRSNTFHASSTDYQANLPDAQIEHRSQFLLLTGCPMGLMVAKREVSWPQFQHENSISVSDIDFRHVTRSRFSTVRETP